MRCIIISLLLITSSLYTATIEDRVQQAIQYAQSNNKVAAKELLSNTLDEQISKEDRAVILYNLASLYLQEENLLEAESIFRQLIAINTGPELSYCININYAITLLLHARRDLEEQSETSIETVKKRILLAEVYLKKTARTEDSQTADTLGQIAATLMKKANQNELYEKLKNSSITDTCSAFSNSLQQFIDGLLHLPSISHNAFIQSQSDLLDAILFFYCRALASHKEAKESKEIEVTSNSLYRKAKNMEPAEVLQQLLFLQFLLNEPGAKDPILEALFSYYESSTLTTPVWLKQQQRRKDYIISLVNKNKGDSAKTLIKAINKLSAQDLITYYNLSLLDPNTLFIYLIEKKGDQPLTLLALQDNLSNSVKPGAKAVLKSISNNTSLINAFALLDFTAATNYLIKVIQDEPNNMEVKKSLLHLFQEIKPNKIATFWCEALISAPALDPMTNTSLAWLSYFASEKEDHLKTLYQAISSSINYADTMAGKVQVKWQADPQIDSVKLLQSILLIDSSTQQALESLDLKNMKKTTRDAIQELIEQAKELIKNRSLPIENHISLLKKAKSILDTLQSPEKISTKQKNGDKETPAMQDTTKEQEQAANSIIIEKTIGTIQEMQKQDAQFDEKKSLGTIPSQVKRPW